MNTPSSTRLYSRLFLAALLLLPPSSALAHKVSAVSVVADFNTETRAFKVELAMDVDPTGDPTIDDQIPPEEAALSFATESLDIYFDDQPMKLEPSIRVVTASDEDTPAELERKKVIGTLSGEIPEGAANFLLHVNETTEAAVVMVTVKDGKPARRLQVLYPGEFSNPVSMEPVMTGDPFPSPAPSPAAAPPTDENESFEATEVQPGLSHWLVRGYRAVLPFGVDFWIFMLAMFLLSLRAKPLGWQVGLYTIAHSLALALGAFQLIALSAVSVAALVAISALYPAVENLFVKELKPWRGAVVAVFGFFHGLAFSQILWAGEPRVSDMLSALIGFNLGVELAQLTVLILASLVAVALAGRPWFRHWVVVPLCVVIAGVSLFRFIDVLWLG